MVAAAFVNPSFEEPDGNPAVLLTQNLEPFVLADEQTMNFEIDGLPQAAVFEVGTRSVITSGNAEVYLLADLQTLDVMIDGAPAVTVIFNSANFANIAMATAAEVTGELLAQLPGSAFAAVTLGSVSIGSLTKGPASLINVSGGTAAAAFNFPAGVAGVNNFVDISLASAAEVVAVMVSQLTGVLVVDVAGAVEISTDSASDTDCLRAVGGLASVALNFPTGEVCGLSNPGEAAGWTHTSTATFWEFVEYGFGEAFPSGHEPFTLGWSSAEDDVTELDDPDLANFSGEFFESFRWFVEGDELPGLISVAFNTTIPLVATAIEKFDQGWPGIPGSEGDVTEFPPGALTDALFDAVNDFEDFDTGWPAEGDGSTLQGLTTWAPGQGGVAETFSPATDIHTEVETFLAVIGDSYEISISGLPVVHVATTTSENDVATNLAVGISNLPADVTAIAVGPRVQITNTSTGIAPFEVGVRGTVLSNSGKVFDGPTDPELNWGGDAKNRFC